MKIKMDTLYQLKKIRRENTNHTIEGLALWYGAGDAFPCHIWAWQLSATTVATVCPDTHVNGSSPFSAVSNILHRFANCELDWFEIAPGISSIGLSHTESYSFPLTPSNNAQSLPPQQNFHNDHPNQLAK